VTRQARRRDLDVLLRGAGANTLVLAGIATSGVVLSTLRQAELLDRGVECSEITARRNR
jgi:nicotinamidase-related amidase